MFLLVRRSLLFLGIALIGVSLPLCAHAVSDAAPDQPYVARATVLNVVSNVPTDGISTPQNYKETVKARIKSGSESGTVVTFDTNYTEGDGEKLNVGDSIFVTRIRQDSADGSAAYNYSSLDFDRLPVVILFLLLFAGCLVYFGGRQGMRGLASLLIGIALIIFILLPGVAHGYSPLLLSVLVASFFATLGAYITHGFSRMTSAAILGMVATIVGTAILAQLAVHFGHLTGITDESTYNLLGNPHIKGILDFQGLLLGGIIIGVLGVLYDAAIGQAVSVEELVRAGPHLPREHIYERAMRIGKEHIGALVNTLVLAYVGVSLPAMIVLFHTAYLPYGGMAPVLNWEFVATEIIRTTVGAMGLILTIPITTRIAVLMLVDTKKKTDPKTLKREEAAIRHIGHTHVASDGAE